MNATVLAVIVTYYPEQEIFAALVSSLLKQVDALVVVDNTPASDDRVYSFLSPFLEQDKLRMVRFGDNLGIATALNLGIEIAETEGLTHVLLSDQDSLPANDMISGLLRVEAEFKQKGVKVGAVGPVYEDEIAGVTFPFQVQEAGRLFYSRRHVDANNPHAQALTLITSGTLIPVPVLREAGKMRDDFFIDYVDVEWCHRVRHLGYMLIGTNYGRMKHRMGDARIPVWIFGWRAENGYAPARLYYRFRNFIRLFGLPYVPARWKVRACWYWAGVFYTHALFSSRRRDSVRMMLRGIRDGLRGKMGRLPSS